MKRPADTRTPRPPDTQRTRRVAYLLATAVVTAVLLVVGIFYYQAYVAPFRRVVITVDDQTVRVGHFLDRTRLAGGRPLVMIRELTNEIIVREGAPQLGIEVTAEEIDRELRNLAGSSAPGGLSEEAFADWYRQQLNRHQVSDALYREAVESRLLAEKLGEYQADRIATVVPQVRVSVIFVDSIEIADQAAARLKAGEDFAQVASAMSTDAESAARGGDIGWIPRGVSIFDNVAFGLDAGQVTEPVPQADPGTLPSSYYILVVTEKAEAREVDAEYLPLLRAGALEAWLAQELTNHTIDWNFDSSMNTWMLEQLAKRQSAGGLP